MSTSRPSGWLVPAWPAPPGVRALCSIRTGGVSEGEWTSMNLGDHVGDRPAHVASNRTRFADAIDARPIFLQQVHGTDVIEIDGRTPDGSRADAAVTGARGVACTIMVADCLPVLFALKDASRVAAAHAGWRGLAGADARSGVLEATFKAISRPAHERGNSGAGDMIAWLGPCIGPKMFEVGAEVREAFVRNESGAVGCFKPASSAGKWLADLPALARRRLRALGIADISGNDGSDAWCTVLDPSRFFSYRRDGVCGRFAASVWLDRDPR